MRTLYITHDARVGQVVYKYGTLRVVYSAACARMYGDAHAYFTVRVPYVASVREWNAPVLGETRETEVYNGR